MTFASEIVSDSLALILVDVADEGEDAADFSISVRSLNDMAAELFDLGIDFGYRPVTVSGDPITSPASVNTALKENLAIRLAPVFGMPVSLELKENARASLTRLKANFLRRPKARLPSTLPMGSGNLQNVSRVGFYPFSLPFSILRLDSSSTVTIATVNVAVRVGGWTVDRSVNLTALAAGTVEYLNDQPYLAMLEANFTIDAADSDRFTFFFRKNSAEIAQSRITFDAGVNQNVLMKWPETLRRGDKIDIAVENNTDATDIVLTNGHFTVN